MAAATKTRRPKFLEATKDDLKLIADLQKARLDKKDAEKREKAAKEKIFNRLGGLRVIQVMGLAVLKVTERERTGTDLQLLQEAFPEAYEATRTKTVYDQIDIV